MRGLFITDKSGVERKSRVAAVVVVYKKKEDVKADARESEVKALPVRVKVNEREREFLVAVASTSARKP